MIDAAFFTKETLVTRDVVLSDGGVHTLHFRELPAIEFRRFQLAEQSTNEERRAGSMAALIAASVRDPDGKLALTTAQANMLSPFAANAIVDAILDINELGEGAKKNSPAEE
jgi:hypothetical protein